MSRLAFIGTGGTIASLGAGPFDLLDYGATGNRVGAEELIERTGLKELIGEVRAVDFRRIDSTAITAEDWADLADLCCGLAADPKLDGIVIGHGTASLEETAFALSLTLALRLPVVLTGSMRPLSGVSSDAAANLAAALRLAASSAAEAGRVYVLLNDEIHDPREVTKAHTLKLNAFISPEFGPLGRLDGMEVRFARRSPCGPRPRFSRILLRHLPRVSIAYSHVGADGAVIDALASAGAQGIVSAGFGPGQGTPDELDALGRLRGRGIVAVQSSRTGAGPVMASRELDARGIIAAGALNPQKARILLALALAQGSNQAEIAELFQTI